MPGTEHPWLGGEGGLLHPSLGISRGWAGAVSPGGHRGLQVSREPGSCSFRGDNDATPRRRQKA